ncbi:MAG: hypothetical protein AAF802_07630 [Planctomycetota bacterium]
MRLTAILSVLITAAALVTIGYDRDAVAATAPAADETIVPVQYKAEDLPVWNKKGEWDPVTLIELIQLASGPTNWESNGGNSTVAPYFQNKSLIISTTSKNHDAIVALLERLRKNRLAK